MKKTIALFIAIICASVCYGQFRFDALHPDVHDPVMAKGEDGRYYIFATGMRISVMSSADLKVWRREPPVFQDVPSWALEEVEGYRGHTWAPDISYHNGQWYLYYSCSSFGKNGSAIGLATNKTLDPQSPDFGWTDQGKVIASRRGKDCWNAIDPNLIVDKKGQPYLVFGSFWDGIQLIKLSKSDYKTPQSEPVTISRRYDRNYKLRDIKFTQEGENTIEAGENAVEAPFVYQHGDYYYLFVSFDYCCRGQNSTYKTVYGRSKKITGPYVDKEGKRMDKGGGTFLYGPNDRYYGVGHNSAYDFDGGSYFLSHAYEKTGGAKIFLRPLRFDKDGWIVPEPDPAPEQAEEPVSKPRLVVCTDIAPADVEPDDMESMVRLMSYADLFEIEALITSVGWNCDPYPKEWQEYLFRVIEAYRQDVPKLMRRSQQRQFRPIEEESKQQSIGYWPSADYLKSRAVMGSERGGIKVVGEGNDSPGSDLLIRLADEDDPRPIYVAAWGGANTLAQAIWRVKQTRSAEELRRFVRKFRIFTITDQDMQYSMRMNRAYSSHQWLRSEFKDDLQFIWDEGAWQEQCELGKQHWQQHADNIQGKGALGREYPTYKWGVEGDTPSFLYVMPHGLNDPEDPRQASWAGYHERGLCPDSLTTAWSSWEEPVRSASIGYKRRFYPDELNDFMARMQWAAEGRGNHNPCVVVKAGGKTVRNGEVEIQAKAGDTIRPDASESFDMDGDHLSFLWWQQPEIGTAKAVIEQADQPVATIRIPADAKGELHLVCEVHDDGPFQLVAYKRVCVSIIEHY